MPSDSTNDFIAGLISGWAQVLVGHPFDTVNLQTQTRYKGAMHCVKTILKEDGFLGLYKGVKSPLTGIGFANSLMFVTNGYFKRIIAGDTPEDKMTIKQHTASGFLSGCVMPFVSAPMENMKIKLQTSHLSKSPVKYKGLIDCTIKTIKSGGLKGLYHGYGITLLRDVPSFSAYFGTYELVKLGFKHLRKDNFNGYNQFELLMAGGLAGVACWIPCIPQDVIKSRAQTTGMSAKNAAKEIYKLYGMKGFFRGFCPTIIRAFPANAVTFVVYEFSMKGLRKLDK
ncbi:mitochondrial carrier [Anaeromyces robustus]|uniref:Mitochondrial carrier n=1 Tax=Anaeromyces robustus TaxID=1754192 RepID=A0A1Y1WQD7_9FUNG|nr:mitochondrial carrier [Anaeromyces robustus]|eukprot:ORX75498.1 mitochondrial carrier [Anaeromyces robustus]